MEKLEVTIKKRTSLEIYGCNRKAGSSRCIEKITLDDCPACYKKNKAKQVCIAYLQKHFSHD